MLKEISGYDNYLVSDDGQIYSKVRKGFRAIHPNKKVDYFTVDLWKNNEGRKFYVHRLVAQAFIPNPNNLPEVNHIDGNRQNNHISNLEWVDSLGNKLHAIRTGLRTYSHKMNDTDYEYCLNEVFNGKSLTDLASNPRFYNLPTLSIKLKEYVIKHDKLDEYLAELKRQRAERNRKTLLVVNANKAQRLS